MNFFATVSICSEVVGNEAPKACGMIRRAVY